MISAMRQGAWTFVVGWLAMIAACDIPPEVKSEMACTTVCTCFENPLRVDECITGCVDKGQLATIPDDCFECIQAHANTCATLIGDCDPLCERPEPPEDDPGPTGPDGGMS